MTSRRERLAAQIERFVRQYARKRRPGRSGEPNDRKYDRGIERAVKQTNPEDLDAIMRGAQPDDDE